MDDNIFKQSMNSILEQYENMGIDQVIFSVKLDEKTCQTCMNMNRSVRSIANARDVIPVHINCRCIWIPLAGGALFGEQITLKPVEPEMKKLTVQPVEKTPSGEGIFFI